MKNKTKRFYNNVNSKMLKNIMDSERSSADSRSRKDRRGGNTNLTVPKFENLRNLARKGVQHTAFAGGRPPHYSPCGQGLTSGFGTGPGVAPAL
jgi:hypothetical protein